MLCTVDSPLDQGDVALLTRLLLGGSRDSYIALCMLVSLKNGVQGGGGGVVGRGRVHILQFPPCARAEGPP